MIKRHFWINLIEKAWQERSIIWLQGVRRSGKTFLAQSLADIEYYDCELPRVRQTLEDPESFLQNLSQGKRIILDEVHRLQNPSELLKIAADHHPKIKIIATGSSSLGASAKFKDTLTGRKKEIWLTPLILTDLNDFNESSLKHRLLRGGLPPFFLSKTFPESYFQEWIDAYWSKDIQELFRLERRHSFQKFLELMLVQSGGIFEATKFTSPCEVSRTTIKSYLNVLEETFLMIIIRPFHQNKSTEIISAPKVYAFDTGFICYYRGWYQIRQQDMGPLWEHFVLNEIQAQLQIREVQYWRDKRGHEIDFILPNRSNPLKPIAIECKWKAGSWDPQNFQSFLLQYPQSKAFVVCQDITKSYYKNIDNVKVQFIDLPELINHLMPREKL